MPELPEVEIACRKLKPLLGGKRFLGFWTDWPRGLRGFSEEQIRKDIRGRKIKTVQRRGKAILLGVSGGRALAFHQKMSGKMLVAPRNIADKHIHFRFPLSDGRDLVLHDIRKFGVVWYGSAEKIAQEKYFTLLGKDALDISFSNFLILLKGRRGALKPLLLRQDIFSGIGNIMADEALWKAGLHPLKRAEALSDKQVKTLWRSLQFVLKRSIKLGGSSMRDWLHPDSSSGGYFQKRFVYGRKGEKCPRCKEKVLRTVIASRGTFICPSCQRI